MATNRKFKRLRLFAGEKIRRLMAANEAMATGYGGIKWCLVPRVWIQAVIAELAEPRLVVQDRVRRPGGGRKAVRMTFSDDPEAITRSDPQLQW